MKYDELKKTFEETIKDVKFEDVYPLKTNNGACLFIQHCVYMLEDNGVCAIVLPDGELFEGNSKWSKAFRKWWTNNVNIQTILKVPSGTFEHAGVKTNVVVFVKNGPTKNIQFIETTKECNMVKDMFTITMDELCASNYSLDVGEYVVEDKVLYDVPMVALKELYNIKYGDKNPTYRDNENNYPSISGGSKVSKYTNEWNILENTILIARSGSCGSVNMFNTKSLMGSYGFCLVTLKDTFDNLYVYYYLKFNQSLIENLARGTAVKNLNRDKLYDFKIPLPSLEVQQQIVDELSLLETSIQTIETRVSQLKMEKEQYKKYGRKAEIRELLKDSEEVALGDVCKINGGKGINERNSIKNNDYNYPYYDSNGIKGYVKEFLYTGEYIVTARKLSIGSLHYVCESYYPSDNTINITSKNKEVVSNIYIYYLLKDNNDILIKMSSGVKPGIRITDVRNLKIPLPSPEVQQKCIELFEQKESYIQSIDDKIIQEKKYIEELKQLAKDVISSHC